MAARLQVTERDVKEKDFNQDPERMIQNYLNVYERVKSEILSTAKYAKDCDIVHYIWAHQI